MSSDSFPNSKGKLIVLDLVKVIQENAHYLSEIDGFIGDGDHGINMSKGFTQCKDLIQFKDINFFEALKTLGEVLLNLGGSMGPLYGSFFLEMAVVCQDKIETDARLFGQMLKAGLESIQTLGNAKIGDKTLIDTLSPAYQAYDLALSRNLNFLEALHRMAEAAKIGQESTRDMVAKIGRASRLGERSRGVPDAGATSCYLILNAFAKSIEKLIS